MIPLATLYYFLCYAWNRLPAPAVLQAAEATPFARPLGLLAQVLRQAVGQRLQTGLPAQFEEHTATLGVLRGRVALSASVGRGLLAQGRAVCVFEELSTDTSLHRALAATLASLAEAAALPAPLRRALRTTQRQLTERLGTAAAQPLPPPTAAALAALRRRLPPAATDDSFLLNICELVAAAALPQPTATGRRRFRDFRRDPVLMAQLFEQFVRNFYRREQRRYRVFAETIAWQALAPDPAHLALLPTMLTDTTLVAPDRKIILDTKFYAAALRPRYHQQRLIAPHLYQLYAYLQNQPAAPGQALEGVLLYPGLVPTPALAYTLGGHPVRVVTLNLAQPWPGIAAELLALVG